MNTPHQVHFRRGTDEEWAKSDYVPLKGEIALTLPSMRFKVGDGIRRYSELDFTDRLPLPAIVSFGRR